MKKCPPQSGLTLLEALLAMAVAAVFLAPMGVWFHKNRHNQRPFEKYIACQLLEREMNRAWVERRERGSEKALKFPKTYKVIIGVKSDGHGIVYEGRVKNAGGRVLARMVKARYH